MDDVGKEDLLCLLAFLHRELEVRENTIAALKSENASYFSHSGLSSREHCSPCPGNPYHALCRDSLITPNSSDGDTTLKSLYDSQLVQLENLIASQRHAQDKMREQVALVEEKYIKACETLEEQRRKHEKDAAQGDDVLVLLEKEREKLKTELEDERTANKRMEKELRTLQTSWCEQRVIIKKQRQAGACLWKARRSLLNRLMRAQERINELEKILEGLESGSSSRPLTVPSADHSCSPDGSARGDTTVISCTIANELCECEVLRKRLNDEVTARLLIQEKNEKLQRKYDALVTATSQAIDLEPSTSIFAEGNTASNATPDSTERKGDSPPRFQRFKPDPPARRSSEISSSVPLCAVYPNVDGLCNDVQPEIARLVSEPTNLDTHEMNSTKNTGFDCDTASSLGSKLTSLSIENSSVTGLSESRSSTPSPPPPPPPIHLHYPYPGMQSQLHHSSLRGTPETSQYLCSPPCDRPLSGPPMHSSSGPKTRGLLNPHPPRQPFAPYQPPYLNSSALQGSRMQKLRVVTSRRSISRKPVSLTTVSQPTSPPTSYHNHYPSFSSIQMNQASQFASSQFVRSSIGLTPSSQPLYQYSPTRPHPPPVPVNPINSSARSSRPIPPSAAGLASGTLSIGTGHVCINGK